MEAQLLPLTVHLCWHTYPWPFFFCKEKREHKAWESQAQKKLQCWSSKRSSPTLKRTCSWFFTGTSHFVQFCTEMKWSHIKKNPMVFIRTTAWDSEIDLLASLIKLHESESVCLPAIQVNAPNGPESAPCVYLPCTQRTSWFLAAVSFTLWKRTLGKIKSSGALFRARK